jgi:aspartate/methionine/tyrosine aminotransferase
MPAGRAAAARMRDISAFQVMEIQKRACLHEEQGRDIVHLEIGEPDFPTPKPVIEAAHRALDAGRIGYTPALGIPELRRAIAGFYLEHYALSLPWERVIVTAGASAALLLVLGAEVDRDQEILMPDPCYPCNRHFLRLVEGRARMIAVDATTRFQPTAAMIREHWGEHTAGVLLASPANPTGMLLPVAEMRSILAFARRQGGVAIVDEIYHRLSYGPRPQTALAFDDQAYVVSSFSKYFNMTGWRLGWLIAPESRVRDLEKLAQNLFICPSQPAQMAALAAFSPETIAIAEARRDKLRARRDFLVPALQRLGFGIPMVPDGAFYIYADCSGLAADSAVFALRILDEAGVAVTPGIDFGTHRAECFLRFAYTQPIARLEQAVERIGKLVAIC